MSFKLLKQVITHLKKTSCCPFCGSGIDEDLIFILATGVTMPSAACTGLFFVVCPKCTAQAFVFVEVTNITAELRKEYIRVHTKPAQGISVNDVLDMHNFLKNWQGDVKELFNELP